MDDLPWAAVPVRLAIYIDDTVKFSPIIIWPDGPFNRSYSALCVRQ